MADRLKNKVAIVTGGTAGIGEAVVRLFAQEGATVVIASTDDEKGQRMVHEIKFRGAEAMFVHTDVSFPPHTEGVVLKTAQAYGKLDCAFNCASVTGVYPIIETTIDQWDAIMNTNLKGTWLSMKYQIQIMMKNKNGGTIVNMASVGGLMGFAYTGAYAASKGGVISLSRTAAIECAQHNIRVNSISPDAVTDVFELLPDELKIQIARAYPLQRASSPDEIARAVLYLCSDDAKSITGHNLVIDGGYSGH
jgi:NAD(P)-dependent dehydrogenase (short-subunit alcohol dehydrogenase family)